MRPEFCLRPAIYGGSGGENFLKYAFFTPIMAFFLNMAAIISTSYEFVFADITTKLAGGSNFATLLLAVASNLLLLVFCSRQLTSRKSFPFSAPAQ